MSLEPTYEELGEVIARFVHSHLFIEEQMVDGSVIRIVDNGCSSSHQIATGVLKRFNILVSRDDIGRRYNFTCSPEAFASVIARNRDKGCSYDTLLLALTCLLSQHPHDMDLRELVEGMGLCEVGDHDEVRWTSKAAHCRALYENWPKLLDE